MRTERIKLGDPMDPATQMGSLISEAHLNKVMGYIEKGKAEGAEVPPALALPLYLRDKVAQTTAERALAKANAAAT